MKAGRELDALIAEKVMGWTLGNYETGDAADSSVSRWDMDDGFEWEGRRGEAHEWKPSTDITTAWEVVEELTKRYAWSRNTAFQLHQAKQWRASFWLRDHQVHPKHGYPSGKAFHGAARAETAPLAICLAALKAVKND